MLALAPLTAVLVFHPAPVLLHRPPVLRLSTALPPARGGQVALIFGRRQQRFRISWPGQRNQGISFPGQRRGGRRRLWFRSQPPLELPGPVGIAATGFGLAAVFALASSAWGQQRVRRDHGFARFPTARFAPDGALEEARTRAAAEAMLQAFREGSSVAAGSSERVREAALGLAMVQWVDTPRSDRMAGLRALQALQAVVQPASTTRALRIATTFASRRRRGYALEAKEDEAAAVLLLCRAMVEEGLEREAETAATRALFGLQGETARSERLVLGRARLLVTSEVRQGGVRQGGVRQGGVRQGGVRQGGVGQEAGGRRHVVGT
jgi:hypothetical protein